MQHCTWFLFLLFFVFAKVEPNLKSMGQNSISKKFLIEKIKLKQKSSSDNSNAVLSVVPIPISLSFTLINP